MTGYQPIRDQDSLVRSVPERSQRCVDFVQEFIFSESFVNPVSFSSSVNQVKRL